MYLIYYTGCPVRLGRLWRATRNIITNLLASKTFVFTAADGQPLVRSATYKILTDDSLISIKIHCSSLDTLVTKRK